MLCLKDLFSFLEYVLQKHIKGSLLFLVLERGLKKLKAESSYSLWYTPGR